MAQTRQGLSMRSRAVFQGVSVRKERDFPADGMTFGRIRRSVRPRHFYRHPFSPVPDIATGVMLAGTSRTSTVSSWVPSMIVESFTVLTRWKPAEGDRSSRVQGPALRRNTRLSLAWPMGRWKPSEVDRSGREQVPAWQHGTRWSPAWRMGWWKPMEVDPARRVQALASQWDTRWSPTWQTGLALRLKDYCLALLRLKVNPWWDRLDFRHRMRKEAIGLQVFSFRSPM
jgi:hypothetical protein